MYLEQASTWYTQGFTCLVLETAALQGSVHPRCGDKSEGERQIKERGCALVFVTCPLHDKTKQCVGTRMHEGAYAGIYVCTYLCTCGGAGGVGTKESRGDPL